MRAAASASALWRYTGQRGARRGGAGRGGAGRGGAGRGGAETMVEATMVEATMVEAAPQLCADLLAPAGRYRGDTGDLLAPAKRRRATPEGAATRGTEEHLGGRCKLTRPRVGVRALVRTLASWTWPISPHTSPHLPTSPRCSLARWAPPPTTTPTARTLRSLYLPISPHISLYLPNLPIPPLTRRVPCAPGRRDRGLRWR